MSNGGCLQWNKCILIGKHLKVPPIPPGLQEFLTSCLTQALVFSSYWAVSLTLSLLPAPQTASLSGLPVDTTNSVHLFYFFFGPFISSRPRPEVRCGVFSHTKIPSRNFPLKGAIPYPTLYKCRWITAPLPSHYLKATAVLFCYK